MTGLNRITKLKEYVLSERISDKLTEELRKNTGRSDFFTVFLSVCNKKERAKVFHGSGNTIRAAWGNAEKRLDEYRKKQIAKKKTLSAIWAKADIVTHYEEIPATDLNGIVANYQWHNFARIGLSFDANFNKAFIEAEVNGNKMLINSFSQEDISSGNIDYSSMIINIDNVNHYLKTYYGISPIPEVPERIIIFTARCFFCGDDDVTRELYCDNIDYGRRRIDLVDDNVINEVIVGASEYLVKLIGDDGRFIYGYFPVFGTLISGYNILRHVSTIWSIINLYRISGDTNLIPKLEKAIE